MRLFAICLICLPMLLPGADLLSDLSSKGFSETNKAIGLIKTSKEAITRRTAFGFLAQASHAQIDKSLIEAALKQSKYPNEFDKTASLIALSPNRDQWCEALFKIKAGQELAAAVQAASAIMQLIGQEKAARMPAPKAPEGDDGAKKKKKKNKKGKSFSGKINAALVLRMLESKSSAVREYAAIAAAYQPDASLDAAVAALENKSGVIAGAQLLYQANNGKALDAALLEKALGKVGKQPKSMRTPNADVMYNVIRTPVLALACEALGVQGKAVQMEALHEALYHGDVRVEIEAAKAMGRIADPSSVDVLLDKVEERKGRTWPVMIQAFDSLGLIPDKKSVQPLIHLLGKETGRLRMDITYALNSIKGEKAHYQNAKQWQNWWNEAEKDFQVDLEKTKAFRSAYLPIDMFVPVNGEFYGLPIFSDRLCFVVDTSNSMRGQKIENLREQATMSIEGLNKVVYFNMVDFGGKVEIYYGGELCQDKKGLIKYVSEMDLSWATRSIDSMEAGMEIGPVDTIYFLSDGAPYETQIKDWGDIHASIDFINRYRPIAMFTVSFSAGKANAVQMERLARWNSGRSHEIE